MIKGGSHDVQGEDSSSTKVGEEEAVITSADAIIEPNTVMVMPIDTVVADTAMMGTRRSPNVAGSAVFHRYFHRGSARLSRLYQHPIVGRRSKSQRVGILVWHRELVKIAGQDLLRSVCASHGKF